MRLFVRNDWNRQLQSGLYPNFFRHHKVNKGSWEAQEETNCSSIRRGFLRWLNQHRSKLRRRNDSPKGIQWAGRCPGRCSFTWQQSALKYLLELLLLLSRRKQTTMQQRKNNSPSRPTSMGSNPDECMPLLKIRRQHRSIRSEFRADGRFRFLSRQPVFLFIEERSEAREREWSSMENAGKKYQLILLSQPLLPLLLWSWLHLVSKHSRNTVEFPGYQSDSIEHVVPGQQCYSTPQ